MDWWDFVKTFGPSALAFVGAIGGVWLTHWLRDERTAKARHGAIRATIVLDEFVIRCAAVVEDTGTTDEATGIRVQEVASPSLVFPEDVEWQALGEQLMYRALALPAQIQAASQHINAAHENDHPPFFEETFAARQRHYLRLGQVAFALSNAIRTQYDILPIHYGDWGPRQAIEEAAASNARRLEEAARFDAEYKSRNPPWFTIPGQDQPPAA